eukprot:1876062-Amphidinium_carterae.2
MIPCMVPLTRVVRRNSSKRSPSSFGSATAGSCLPLPGAVSVLTVRACRHSNAKLTWRLTPVEARGGDPALGLHVYSQNEGWGTQEVPNERSVTSTYGWLLNCSVHLVEHMRASQIGMTDQHA